MKPGLILCLSLVLLSRFASAEGQQQFATLEDLKLENGDVVLDCRLGYRTFGELRPDRSNVVVLSTWFTGRTGEMSGLLGPGKLIDTSKYYVIAIDALANGISSSPSNSKRQARMKFPAFSVVDVVNSEYKLLTTVLGIHHVKAVVGSSTLGGQATLHWTVAYPDFMDKAVAISASPRLTAYNLVFQQALRDAITGDPLWNNGNYGAQPGTRLVAELATLVDNNPEAYNRIHSPDDVQAAIRNMTEVISRFDANDLLRQSEAISDDDLSRKFGGSMQEAAKAVKAKLLIIVSANERIVNPGPVLAFAKLVGADVLELHNDCGQVLSECEIDKVNSTVAAFLGRND